MHLYFSLYGQQLCVSAQAFTIRAKVARFQIRRLSRRHLLFPPSKSVGIFFMIAHLITLIINSFTSSVGFPAERSLLRKARSAPRNSRASSGDSSTIRFSALRRSICSTSIPFCPHCIRKCASWQMCEWKSSEKRIRQPVERLPWIDKLEFVRLTVLSI